MRSIVLILFLFFSCKAGNEIVQGQKPASFVILIQYQQDAGTNVLDVLHRMTMVEHFVLRERTIFSGEIEATCSEPGDIKIDELREQLQQTAGVVDVVINPIETVYR